MDEVLQYLSPFDTMESIKSEAQKLKDLFNEYSEYTSSPPDFCHSLTTCTNCHNTEESRMCYDENTGDYVCMNCGMVLVSHMLEHEFVPTKSGWTEHELFSPHFKLTSTMTSGGVTVNKFNKLIERKLGNLSTDCLMTSDVYKDEQRMEVYALLENMKHATNLPQHTIDGVKVMYHRYRSHMSRIHKLNRKLAAMFYLLLNN